MKESLTLIGFIALILFLFSLPSCNPIDTNVYECTISYTIGDNPYPFTETVEIDLPTQYTPAYSCGSGKITLIGSGAGSYQMPCKNIYNGDQKVMVTDFKYSFIRNYKASRLDGHELKSRKK